MKRTTKKGRARLGPAGRALRAKIRAAPDGARIDAEARLAVQAQQLVADALEASKMTQSELARRLGKDRASVNRLVKGVGAPNMMRLDAVLRALGRRLVLADEKIRDD